MVQGKELPIVEAFSHTIPSDKYRAYGPHGFVGILKRTKHSLKSGQKYFY